MWTAVRFAAGPRTWFARGPVPFLKMIGIALPALAIVAIPAAVVSAALVVGAVIEWVTYAVLRVARRDQAKAVNSPQLDDVFTSN